MVARASALLLDEYFANANDRFIDELLALDVDRKLFALAPKWFEDERPWARDMLLRYIDDGCNRPMHRGLVKSLFKLAEGAGDDLLMAHFLVAFDRLVSHEVRAISKWVTAQEPLEYKLVRTTREPLRQPRNKNFKRGTFSIYTRQYMQRRALRYFRQLGFRDLARFGKAARIALLLYENAHVERSPQLLDAWGLMHLLYHGSPVIVRDPRGIRVAEGRTMAQLEPAPMHPDVWLKCFDELMTMLPAAPSLIVRRWIVAWLENNYQEQLRAPDIRKVKRLLWSPHADVQSFAADLLGRARGLETLPIVEWLSMLDIENAAVIPVICDLVARHVSPDRLDLAACVELACARPAAVAELGLRWARSKAVDDRDALQIALGLIHVKAANVVDDAFDWLTTLIARPSLGRTQHVLDLLDARTLPARSAGMKLMTKQRRFADDLALWGALAESPYADIRTFLIRHLDKRLLDLPEDGVRRIWATTLLSVSGGSRTKRLVLRQLAARVTAQTDQATELLPLMAVALRSVREPERRDALAAIAKAAFAQPALRAPLAKHIPELVLFAEASP